MVHCHHSKSYTLWPRRTNRGSTGRQWERIIGSGWREPVRHWWKNLCPWECMLVEIIWDRRWREPVRHIGGWIWALESVCYESLSGIWVDEFEPLSVYVSWNNLSCLVLEILSITWRSVKIKGMSPRFNERRKQGSVADIRCSSLPKASFRE